MQGVLQKPDVRWWMFVGPGAVLLGAALAYNPTFGFILFGLLCLAGVLAVPATFLIGTALVCALGLRVFITFGWVPGIVGFADIPLAWLALAVALIHRRATSVPARRALLLTTCLIASVALSWSLNPSEMLRPLLYAALLGEPFAIITAMLLVPPSPRARRILVRLIVGLLTVQVPIGIYQAVSLGIGDSVTGTLYGAGAGPHVLGGCLALGILFCLASRHWARWIAIGALGTILVLADPKQVYVALFAGLAVMRFISARQFRFVSALAIGTAALFVLLALPTASVRLNQFQNSETGKALSVELLTTDLDAPTLLAGRGPAETVSRSAFITTEFLLREESPIRAFHLHPSEMATQAQLGSLSLAPDAVNTSVNSPLSSALGVFGDLGIIGASVVALFVLFIVRQARHRHYGSAVIGAWTMYGVLGFIYDWWEQPPFTVLLAVFTGLVLSELQHSHPVRPRRRINR